MFENEIRSRTIKMDNPIDQDGQPLVQKLQRERVGGALAVLQGPLLSIAASANTACCFSTSATHMGSHDAAKGSTAHEFREARHEGRARLQILDF